VVRECVAGQGDMLLGAAITRLVLSVTQCERPKSQELCPARQKGNYDLAHAAAIRHAR